MTKNNMNETKKVDYTWIEYFPGDWEELCRDTAGTGWLTEDPDTAKEILRDFDESDEYEDAYVNDNQSKLVILFIYGIPEAVISFGRHGSIDCIFGTGRSESVSGSAIEAVRKKLT